MEVVVCACKFVEESFNNAVKMFLPSQVRAMLLDIIKFGIQNTASNLAGCINQQQHDHQHACRRTNHRLTVRSPRTMQVHSLAHPLCFYPITKTSVITTTSTSLSSSVIIGRLYPRDNSVCLVHRGVAEAAQPVVASPTVAGGANSLTGVAK